MTLPAWRLLEGVVPGVLGGLEDGSVDAIVTSPPYWGLREYGVVVDWPEMAFSPMPALPEIAVPAMRCELGQESDPTAFAAHMVLVFRELRRVLRRFGTVWLNFGDTYISSGGKRNGTRTARPNVLDGPSRRHVGLPRKSQVGIPWRVAFALQADGWILRSDVTWEKTNAMPWGKLTRPSTSHETVFLLARQPQHFYDELGYREPTTGTARPRGRLGRTPKSQRNGSGARNNNSFASAVRGVTTTRAARSVWSIPTLPSGSDDHSSAYPPELARRCIALGTSARGVCPRCSAPWWRITERRSESARQSPARHRSQGNTGHRGAVDLRSIDWKPGCECGADPIPSTILDPFSGTGRTGEAALDSGRSYVGVEGDPSSAAHQRQVLGRFLMPPAEARGVDEEIDYGPLFRALKGDAA